MKFLNKHIFVCLLLTMFSLFTIYNIFCYFNENSFFNIIEGNDNQHSHTHEDEDEDVDNTSEIRGLRNKIYKNSNSIAELNAKTSNLNNVEKELKQLDAVSKQNKESIAVLHKQLDAKLE